MGHTVKLKSITNNTNASNSKLSSDDFFYLGLFFYWAMDQTKVWGFCFFVPKVLVKQDKRNRIYADSQMTHLEQNWNMKIFYKPK